MFWLRQIAMFFVKTWSKRLTANHLRKEGILVYLRTLQTVRKSLMLVLVFLTFLQLIVVGLAGCFVTGVMLTDVDPQTKLWILFGGFAFILVLPAIGLAIFFSESVWFKVSGADEFFTEEKSEHGSPRPFWPLQSQPNT